ANVRNLACHADRALQRRPRRATELQDVRRSAESMHEELCRTDLQIRVSDVHEVLQKVAEPTLRNLSKCLIAALATGVGGLVALDADFVSAENVRKLTGAQIRAKFAGMQLTDEVHYRLVYERDGTLRSVEMGVKKRGKWTINKDQLCLYLSEQDDGCYDVTL